MPPPETARDGSPSAPLQAAPPAFASQRLLKWIKARETPLSDAVYRAVTAVRGLEVPVIRPLHLPLYFAVKLCHEAVGSALRVLLWTPLFKARMTGPARGLRLNGNGLPYVKGALSLRAGCDCIISTLSAFTGRVSGSTVPELVLGDRVFIGWDTTIAVGQRVVLGNDVLIAGKTLLAGYPGHPLDPKARAAGLADTPDQVGDIVLEDAVWLATGVTVTSGVRIGRGTVVAAGSVVTRDLPAGVLAGGVPARVIRVLTS